SLHSYRSLLSLLYFSYTRDLHSFPTRRSSDLLHLNENGFPLKLVQFRRTSGYVLVYCPGFYDRNTYLLIAIIKHWDHNKPKDMRSEEHTSELQSRENLVCRLLLEKKNKICDSL